MTQTTISDGTFNYLNTTWKNHFMSSHEAASAAAL